MKRQTVMWTALPNGVSGTPGAGDARVRLSVFVSPRLETNEGGARPTLSQFPDFLNWPERVAEMQFSVQFGAGPAIMAERIAPPGEPPAAELWASLFDANVYVEPYEFPDMSARPILSFPVRNVVSRLKETYQAVGIESPVEIPRLTPENQSLQGVRRLFQDISLTPQRSTQISQQLASRMRLGGLKVVQNPAYEAASSQRVVLGKARVAQPQSLVAGVAPAAVEFHQLQAFHKPPVTRPVARLTAQALVESIDFHRILSSLGQYPGLLRRLGLVIDLEVPFTADLVGATTVRVVPQWSPELATATVNRMPRTHCVLTNQAFRARTRSTDSDLGDGMLRLDDDERFEVGQFDVDGAAIKTMELARKVTLKPALALAPRALTVTPRLMRPGTVEAIPAAQTQPEPEPEQEEAALPTLRSAGLWVARVDRAVMLANILKRATSLNQLMLASPQPDEEVSFYAEDLTRGHRLDVWDSASEQWHSLCGRVGTYAFTKSGRELTLEDDGWVSTAATESSDGSSEELRVHEVLLRWEGWSLCAPRPGKAVEEEGAETLSQPAFGLEASFVPSSSSLPRLRFGTEYRLRARAVDLAGSGLSLEEADDSHATEPITYFRHEPVAAPVTVPRTSLSGSPGESLEHAVIRSFNDEPAKDRVRSEEVSERHEAPPKTSELLAETHGMFDNPADGMRGDAATYNLIVSRDQSLAESYDVAQLQLPYLPDPLAAGALIRFKPLFGGRDAQEQVLRIPFEGAWPDLEPFRMVLYEDPDSQAEVAFDTDRRALRVPLPKAEMAEIIISTYAPPTELPRMAMWRWVVEGIAAPALKAANLPQAESRQVFRQLHEVRQMPGWMGRVKLSPTQVQKVVQLKQEAEKGEHWMLTPHRRLVVVHAVQQPLIIPQWQQPRANKGIGETYATLLDQVPISGKSTAKLDIQAQWEEPVDILAEPGPRRLLGKADVGETALQPQQTMLYLRQRHEFGDTKYRRVTYQALASSRFREYFDPDDVKSGALDLTRTSEQVAVDVLSSARPAPPDVLYVIPTFGWTKQKTATGVTSTRSGQGLRVYLERPWYSSGDGELLGVVLAQPQRMMLTMRALVGGTARLKDYVSHWGQDPLWQSAAVTTSAPPLQAFTAAQATESGLTLEEVPGAKVQVAGHEVGYDEERQLWYCDIEIDCGQAYYPFVRLALARYQPMSVKGPQADVKLSRVVLADFAQLAPDRTATVVLDQADQAKVNVTVTGPTYAASEASRGSQVEVSVEKRQGNVEGVMGWVPASTEPFALTRQRRRIGSAWTGSVTLPGPRGSQPFRLVIREYEIYYTDKIATATTLTALRLETARRLVYADAVEI